MSFLLIMSANEHTFLILMKSGLLIFSFAVKHCVLLNKSLPSMRLMKMFSSVVCYSLLQAMAFGFWFLVFTLHAQIPNPLKMFFV
jgi:hypothetical protein